MLFVSTAYALFDSFSLPQFADHYNSGIDSAPSALKAAADYTPIFFSAVPDLIKTGKVPIDVALIQISSPDSLGNMNLGISVDVTRVAVDKSELVIAQANPRMPEISGDGQIGIDEVDFIISHDEPVMEYRGRVPGDITRKTGGYVVLLVADGSTIQVGYGSLPDAISYPACGTRSTLESILSSSVMASPTS